MSWRKTLFGGLSFLILLFITHKTLADGYFQPLRQDHGVPEACQQPHIADFFETHKLITYSINGAIQSGFTHEYPLKRDEANTLWHLFKGGVPYYKSAPPISKKLRPHYEIMLSRYVEKDFDFDTEGEVLELLALVDLEKEYPPQEYFHTGGIEYTSRYVKQHHTMGELDIVIGRISDCKIVAIGESKLGLHRLGKAKEQLARFMNFLNEVKKESQQNPRYLDSISVRYVQ